MFEHHICFLYVCLLNIFKNSELLNIIFEKHLYITEIFSNAFNKPNNQDYFFLNVSKLIYPDRQGENLKLPY